jgi:beta-glucosidase
VELARGESTDVQFTLGWRDLAHWSTTHRRWVIEPGEFTLEVGASSRDIRLRTDVRVEATPPRPVLDGSATLDEWMADAAAASSATPSCSR